MCAHVLLFACCRLCLRQGMGARLSSDRSRPVQQGKRLSRHFNLKLLKHNAAGKPSPKLWERPSTAGMGATL